ncbi:MAG TPA: hypothetical protein VFH55_04755 [Nitrospiria bacterium]|nr:hypothetical protein [Nitrospiria bacterium]
MMAEDVLLRLEQVRRSGKGWTARCPGHEDKNPSLTVHEGDFGLLLKCWGGCTLDEICSGLGIHSRDLFYDERPDPIRRDQVRTRKQMEAEAFDQRMAEAGILREAEGVIRAATEIDISRWTPDQLDRAMETVADARLILLKEERREWTR